MLLNACVKIRSRTYLTKECTHHTSRISALVYHPRGKNDAMYSHIFVSASWDQTIQIWDDRKVASLWFVLFPQSHVLQALLWSASCGIGWNRHRRHAKHHHGLLMGSQWRHAKSTSVFMLFVPFQDVEICRFFYYWKLTGRKTQNSSKLQQTRKRSGTRRF